MSENYFEVFVDLVARMRQAQVDYINYRASESFQLAKKLEREVDESIASRRQPQPFK